MGIGGGLEGEGGRRGIVIYGWLCHVINVFIIIFVCFSGTGLWVIWISMLMAWTLSLAVWIGRGRGEQSSFLSIQVKIKQFPFFSYVISFTVELIYCI